MLWIAAAVAIFVSGIAAAGEESARKLEVLFFGDDGHHKPLERYKILKEAVGPMGIHLTYEKRMEALTAQNLSLYDVVLIYANHQNINEDQLAALVGFVEGGGGLVPVHCGSACFKKIDGYVALVGGQIQKHGDGMVTARVVAPEHPAMRGLEPFEVWDETYQHWKLAGDLTILQRHGEEPWTWVRQQGKGRVFYTAHGHDERCWNHAGFQDLLLRGIVWAAGDGKGLPKLPELNYSKPILPADYESVVPLVQVQEPLAPEQTLKRAQVPVGFEISLYAAEPDIVNPIAMAWDERDRLWVVEALDYPNNLGAGHDRIKICEDSNGDGKADKFTIFADQLSVVTSLTHSSGGVLVTNGTQVLLLKDTNGDDKADERQVVLEGFSVADTHAGVSNLRRGFDGWIYGTVGTVGFKGKVAGKEVEFDTGPFRFLPDGSKLEFLGKTTNNTWGLGFTEDFDVVGSTANRRAGWQVVGDQGDVRDTAGAPEVYPITLDVQGSDGWDPPIEVLGNGRIRAKARHLTAGSGHGIYTARRFPKEWWNRAAFVCEPTGHLVSVGWLSSTAADLSVEHAGMNLYASSDAWSAPVVAETGPDGAVWIADWYNIIVQHNRPGAPFEKTKIKRGKGGAYVTPLRDEQMGRIYRVFPRGEGKGTKVADDLVARLSDPSLVRRLNAQRLIVDGKRIDLAPALRQAVEGEFGQHALYALSGLGDLDGTEGSAVLRKALGSKQPELRRAALAVWPAGQPCPFDPLDEKDPFVIREWLLWAARAPSDESLGRKLFTWLDSKDKLRKGEVLGRCFAAACARHASGFLLAALEKLPDEKLLDDKATKAAIAAFVAGPAEPVVSRITADNSLLAARIQAELQRAAQAKAFTPPAEQLAQGQAVFTKFCAACHQNDGRGTDGAFPPLDGAKIVAGDPEVLVRIVIDGLTGPVKVPGKAEINSLMPAIPDLNDQEVAAVLTYVRHAWSNDAPPVNAALVSKVRAASKERKTPWTLKELNAQ